MELKPIRNKKDYQSALKRMDEIFFAKPNTPEGNETEILSMLIEKYEDEHVIIEAPDPIELIKHCMEAQGITQKDLANIIGSKSRASEILNKKRALNLPIIRKLHEEIGIPTKGLIQEYELTA